MNRRFGIAAKTVTVTAVMMAASCTSRFDDAEPLQKTTSALTSTPTLLATAPAADTVKLLWNNVPGNTGVWFDRSTNGGVAWSAIQQLPAGTTSWDDGSRSADTAYCYRVRVVPTSLAPTSNVACVTTPVGLEAETATRTLSAGGTASVIAAAGSSQGQVLLADVGSTGFVELSMNLPEAGRYRVKAVFQTGADRGRTQLSIDGVDQGVAFDSYTTAAGIAEVDLGDVDISKVGVSKKLRFRVTGKNAAATSYKVGLDVVRMYNSGRRFEAETSNPTVSSGDSRAAVVDTAASGGKVDVSQLNAAGDYIKVTVPVGLTGDYRLAVRHKTGSDRGKFQTSFDGTTNVGGVIDGYASAAAAAYVLTELGTVTVGSTGNHEIRFTVTGKSGSASSFGVSVDYVELRPSRGAQQLTGYLVGPKASAPLIGPVPAATTVDISIALPLRNRAALDTFVRQISDPASPTFGQGLTPAQVTSTYGPTAADYQAATDWAQANGLTVVQTYPNRTVLDVRGTADAINRALFVNLVYRQRPDGTQFYVVDREPSIGVAAPVLWIAGLDNFVLPQPSSGSGTTTSGPGAYLGDDFRRAYASCGFHLTGAGQRVGIFGLAPGINVADVAAYETAAGRVTHVPVNVYPAGSPMTGDGSRFAREMTMDVELAIAMAPGLAEVVVFQGPNYLSQFAGMTNRQPLCSQISSSFEFEPGSGINEQLAVMAAQNQSFFTSSGDNGAWQPGTGGSSLNLAPQTIVGGTLLTMNGAGVSYVSETTWNEGVGRTSGGGIITFTPVQGLPDYQQGISMATNGGSTTARNAPDVAMVASNVEIVWMQSAILDAGTSASAPLWAGFMALANEQRQAAGRMPLGFVNGPLYGISKVPAIYGATFNDIQDNSSNGTYHAVAGYDLAVGVGTPKCNLLYQLATPTVTTPVPNTTITVTGNVTLELTFRSDGHTTTTVTPVNIPVHVGIATPIGSYNIVANGSVPASVSGGLRLAPNPVNVLAFNQRFVLGPAQNNNIPGMTISAGGSAPLQGQVSTGFPPTSQYSGAHMTWNLTLQSTQP
jgi:hypothetical protein